MEEQSRLFIAIPMPNGVKSALSDCLYQLSSQFPKGVVRWVRKDLIHLTVCFLGDTAVSKIPIIIKQLDQITQTSKPFMLQLDQLGCFPSRKKPHVLWVGLQGEMAQLHHLKQTIDQQLHPLGFPLQTRKYNPHLTIGRIKDSQKGAKIKWGSAVEMVHFQVTAVTLYQSKLTANGPIYTPLHTSKFIKSG